MLSLLSTLVACNEKDPFLILAPFEDTGRRYVSIEDTKYKLNPIRY